MSESSLCMKKTMKKILISVVLTLFFCAGVYAKRYKSTSAIHASRVDNMVLHYGYSIGFGVFDYRITNLQYGGEYGFLAEPVKFSPALRLGVIGEWNMTNHLSLRSIPGLYFGKRKITYTRKEIPSDVEDTFFENYPLSMDSEVMSVYADIPLLFKYRGKRINNYNFYLLAGASYHMDLTPHDDLDIGKNRLIRTKRNDFALDVGGGMDLYFRYFKVGMELRISIGLVDVLNHDLAKDMDKYHIYTQTIGSMKSTLVTLSFNFE